MHPPTVSKCRHNATFPQQISKFITNTVKDPFLFPVAYSKCPLFIKFILFTFK